MMQVIHSKKRPFPLQATLLLLVAICLLGYGLRLIQADAFSFWTDEGLTPLRAGYDITEILSNRIIIQDGVTRDTHPPFFYLIIHVTHQLFGESDFAYRYPSLLFSFLTIPLLYQFGRRLAKPTLGMIAALLLAINPLQIWYANEARMYPLLVFLTLAATYLLWRALQTGQSNHSSPSHRAIPQYVGLYFLTAGLAFYTHYTTAFLILGQGIFWLWLLWRKGYKRLVGGAILGGLLASLPLIPFTIPRLFSGQEANFYYVSPLIMLQDVYRFFALGRTVDYRTAVIQFISLAGLGLAVLGLYAAQTRLKQLLLLTSLLSVVFGLMVGSLIKPMYQGVRHIMIGSPIFVLLLAWGMFACWQLATASISRSRRLTGWILSVLATAVVIGGSLFSLYNYFNNPRYIKDDYRALVEFVEANAGDNDVVVYNNAILLPLHAHYQQRKDLVVTASPVYPYGANTSPPQLDQLARQYERIWFVTEPPADKRDSTKAVEGWLDTHLRPLASYQFPSSTTVVRARVFATTPATVTAVPAQAKPLSINWANLPTLAAVEADFDQPASDPALWFNFYWQAAPEPTRGTQLRLSLRDSNGRIWTQHDAPIQPDDTSWPTADLVQQNTQLPLPPDLPPGTYTLFAQPVTLIGETLDEVHQLLTIEVAHTPALANTAWPLVRFANGIDLLKIETADTDVRPGHTLPLTLLWQTAAEQQDLRYTLEVIDSSGQQLRIQSDPPGAPWLTTTPANTLLREETGLYFPPDAQPGRYRLRWQLTEAGQPVKSRPFWRPWFTESVTAGSVVVEPWPLVTTAPEVAHTVNAQFGEAIQLVGYDLAQTNTQLHLTLIWRATAVPPGNDITFVHLINASGDIVAQHDFIPVEGLRPTSGWRPNEVLIDPYTFDISDLPAGAYHIRLGFFNPDTFERPSVILDGTPQPDNQLILTEVTLP